MKKYSLLFSLVSTLSFYSCKKDNDAPEADAAGYWRGYLGDTPAVLLAIINHRDGSGRAYMDVTNTDTSGAIVKMNGKWYVTNNIFYGTYIGPFNTANDTLIFQAVMEPPFVDLRGVFMIYGEIGAAPFRIVRVE